MEHRYCDRMLAVRAFVIAMSTVLLVPTAVASADDDSPPPGPAGPPPVSRVVFEQDLIDSLVQIVEHPSPPE